MGWNCHGKWRLLCSRVLFFFNVRLQVSWLQLPNSPHSHINTIKPLLPFLFFYQVKCSYDNTEMLCLLNCIYIYIYLLHLCAFFTTRHCPQKDIIVAQMIAFLFFDPSLQWKIYASEILATFKMSIVNIYLFTENEIRGMMFCLEHMYNRIHHQFPFLVILQCHCVISSLYAIIYLYFCNNCVFFFCWTSKINS